MNARDFEQCKHIEIIVLAICWRLSAFKSPSHEKSIFLKIPSFFSFRFFQGHNWLTNYPDAEFHGHWKTVTLSSISPNLSKHWRFLAFWLSLCFGSFLLFLVCHDTAFLFSTRVMPRLADFHIERVFFCVKRFWPIIKVGNNSQEKFTILHVPHIGFLCYSDWDEIMLYGSWLESKDEYTCIYSFMKFS